MLTFDDIVLLVFAFLAVVAVSEVLARKGRAWGLVARRDLLLGLRIPTAGGLGFLPGLVCIAILMPEPVAAVAATLLLAAVGFVDDVRDLGPKAKLAAELVICAPVAWLSAGVLGPGVAALYLIAFVGTINLVNFSDNMDGLAAILTATTAAAVLVCALLAGSGPLAAVAAVVIAVCTGFLIRNKPPARLHMGDTGSMSLGFVLGLLVAECARGMLGRKLPAAAAAVGLLLGVMLLDGVQVIVARAILHRPLMPGDRRHLSHRLLKLVGSKWKMLGVLWEAHAVSAIGAMLVLVRPELWVAVTVPMVVGGVGLVAWLWRVPGDEYPKAPPVTG